MFLGLDLLELQLYRLETSINKQKESWKPATSNFFMSRFFVDVLFRKDKDIQVFCLL